MINAVGSDIPDYLLVNGKEVYQGKNYKDGQLVKKATPTTVRHEKPQEDKLCASIREACSGRIRWLPSWKPGTAPFWTLSARLSPTPFRIRENGLLQYYDCIICPEYQILNYSTTNRDGYREYKSNPKICANCPTREKCTKSKNCVKTVTRHIWKGYEELAEDARHTPFYARMYKLRKETIEHVFADAKEKHAMRYTILRGLTQVRNWVRLKFAAMNLKKLAR